MERVDRRENIDYQYSDQPCNQPHTHHYILNSKNFGVCRYCGAEKQFRGCLTDKEWEKLEKKKKA